MSRQVALNVSTERYFLRPVLADVVYRIQLLAYNDLGDGPRTDLISIGQSPTLLACMKLPINCLGNTQDEVTSQSLWSQYDRHSVGITRHDALS